ncbi:tight adherence pilus pseudopilin TadF [Pantoea sp. BAV 3049]|uniref:tight adherence pilus pseudopilin TadF n=1 Tax=Pantoea sp. BAV 3049 TaxID=2654188 RepID=UPI00131D5418|nr:tight adherence pilus pseudopilin TadF [Pantoea sp. BAV 3049]
MIRYLKIRPRLHNLLQLFAIGTGGVVAIEASFIFAALVTLCMATVDYGFWLTRKSQAEAVSYSLVSVLRERRYLYNGTTALTTAQLNQLTKLAETLLGSSSVRKFCLTIESLDFKDQVVKKVSTTILLTGGATNCKLQPAIKLTELTGLSPWSNRSRWIPLYQVTLSVPVPKGTLSSLLQGVGALPENVVVSNIALLR